jgi:hypothetical protein
MTLASSIIAKARIVNYDSGIVIYSFIVLATVIMVINYDRTVITIVNYDHKTFIVQATGLGEASFFNFTNLPSRVNLKCVMEPQVRFDPNRILDAAALELIPSPS